MFEQKDCRNYCVHGVASDLWNEEPRGVVWCPNEQLVPDSAASRLNVQGCLPKRWAKKKVAGPPMGYFQGWCLLGGQKGEKVVFRAV